jgi:hypothetical protein
LETEGVDNVVDFARLVLSSLIVTGIGRAVGTNV